MLMMSPDREFEFQLHELRYDLAALLRKVLELTPLMVPEKSQELERALSDICGSIEHDYIWHSSRALDLARPLAPHPEDCARRPDAETDRDSAERWARVDEVMSEVQDADELRRQLRPEIAELSASLHEAAASVARVEALRSRPDASAMQVEKLLEQVHAGLGEAMCLAFSAMQKATWHYRVTDPAAWQAEKDELEHRTG